MYGGFLGALIGYHLGKRIGRNFGPKQKMFEMSFEMSLLVLATLVIRADGKIKQEELLRGTKSIFSRNLIFLSQRSFP